ncbi:hypothetical protein MT396_05260 [Paenibacillus polymyxa]|nr:MULTISPECIES: hypothetical protein [Paenibacillus]MCJ1219434.1 hypothetical protein [Paenibacillus polymyxa]
MDELREEVDMNEERNRGLNKEVVVRYAASAVVGIMEWWFMNEKPLHRSRWPSKLACF